MSDAVFLRRLQFVEKEPTLAEPVLRALLRFWPLTNSQKEVLFLGELEEILEITQVSQMRSSESMWQHRALTCLHHPVAVLSAWAQSTDLVDAVSDNALCWYI